MASTLTTRGADIAMRALRLGAADYVPKPSSIGAVNDETFRRELVEKVKGLARLRRRAAQPTHAAPAAALKLRPPSALPARLLADRQFHRRPAGLVHPGAGARAGA